MNNLKVTFSVSNAVLTATFNGDINEHSVLPEPDLNGIKQIVLDLDGVRYFNSSGARNWLLWSGRLPVNRVNVVMCKVRPVFIRTFPLLRDFLPKGLKVESVYVPYFCEHCNSNHDRLIFTADFNKSAAELENFVCPSCTQMGEIDASVETYVQVLKMLAGRMAVTG